jgi:hypothetical protein
VSTKIKNPDLLPLNQWDPMIFRWFFCIRNQYFFCHLWGLLGGHAWIWMKSNLFWSWLDKLTLGPLGMRKWLWPSIYQYRMFFMLTSALTPSMHRKCTKYGWCCMQNNQLVARVHVELEDNSTLWCERAYERAG